MKRILKGGKKEGFTLAEILLSLTVIGIVAAIALPSLLGNANERAWETQKRALYTRMAQAIPLMPSLNGYGELSEDKDTAADSFVRDGLSKVIKISNICTSSNLTDCSLPDKIIALDGTTKELSSIDTFGELNSTLFDTNYTDQSRLKNALTAAFETVNGESILVYYNPFCQANLEESNWANAHKKICANFIYDLNGQKGPNTVGKDIGFMSALYATDSVVAAPFPYPVTVTKGSTLTQSAAITDCKSKFTDSKLPNAHEAISIVANKILLNNSLGGDKKTIWTSLREATGEGWAVTIDTGTIFSKKSATESAYAVCLKR